LAISEKMHINEDDPFCLMPRLIPNVGESIKNEDDRLEGEHVVDQEPAEPLNLSLNGTENW
jgi:hypothetical protein